MRDCRQTLLEISEVGPVWVLFLYLVGCLTQQIPMKLKLLSVLLIISTIAFGIRSYQRNRIVLSTSTETQTVSAVTEEPLRKSVAVVANASDTSTRPEHTITFRLPSARLEPRTEALKRLKEDTRTQQ